jgi:hypothetical protein
MVFDPGGEHEQEHEHDYDALFGGRENEKTEEAFHESA